MGGYFGGKLARAGYDVTFLARGEHLKAIRQNGLTIKSIQGDFKVDPVNVTDKIKAVGSADLIIIAVKAWQIKEVAKDLADVTKKGKTVAFIDSFPYDSTSSLTRDIWEGKPSEIEYQNGTVVKLAEKYGIETPVNKFVYHCILPMEIKARKSL